MIEVPSTEPSLQVLAGRGVRRQRLSWWCSRLAAATLVALAVGACSGGDSDDSPPSTSGQPAGTIVVEAVGPAGSAADFAFGGDLGSFRLAGRREFPDLRPGTFSLTEEHPFPASGLVLGSLDCDDARTGSPSAVDLAERTVTIRLDPGETVTCRFVNTPPNVILLLSDDQAYDHYGFMGNEIVLTPNLDRLAAESLVFPLGFTTSSLCTPSHVALQTGLDWPQWTVIRRASRSEGVNPMQHADPIAGLLGELGYVSFQGGKWWTGPPTEAGFTVAGAPPERFGRESIADLFAFLDRRAADPFYVFFAPMLPHTPWDAPPEYVERYEGAPVSADTRAFYANISRLDDRIGEVLDYLAKHGLRESTLVVFLADNGYEHGPLDERVLLGHDHGKLSPYEFGFRTPIMFSLPGVIPEGFRDDVLISAADLYPTILSLAGSVAPPGRVGLDLQPLLSGTSTIDRDAVVGMTHALRTAVWDEPLRQPAFFYRDAEWRYIWFVEQARDELYRIVEDPYETTNVVKDFPGLAVQFRAEIEDYIDRMGVPDIAVREPAVAPCIGTDDS